MKSNTLKKIDPLQHRLDAYHSQAIVYQKTQTGRQHSFRQAALKGSLATLIPMAAVSALNAQCQGGLAAITLNSGNTNVGFDVDGDMVNDFSISYKTDKKSEKREFKLNPLNGFEFLGKDITKLNTGATISSGAGNWEDKGKKLYKCDESGNFGNTSGYIGIRNEISKDSYDYGFIAVTTTVDCDAGTYTFNISERGIEIDGNDEAVAGSCATLPVELIYFQAEPQKGAIVLQWGTATELNNDGFEIQRSTDGRSFYKVGLLSGQGTSQISREYKFVDVSAKANTNYYYRLKQMDFDGSISYSNVEHVMLKDDNKLEINNIYPNPISRHLSTAWMEVHLPKKSDIHITIMDVRGAVMKTIVDHMPEGTSNIPITIRDFAPGHYYIKVQLQQEVMYRKLVVQ